jgi:predicted O-methyltransferase YrrM
MERSDEENYERVTDYYARALEGHVYARETVTALFDVLAKRMQLLGSSPRILELGSHAGITTEWLLRRWPDAEVVVQDENEELIAMSRRRLSGERIEYHTRPLGDSTKPMDLVISLARHHHLPHDYLTWVRRVMKPAGVYVMADELCPEYCEDSHADRIAQAEIIHIAGGYVLTTAAEVSAFQRNGSLAACTLDLERRRQLALWRWYRFVVDDAVNRGYVDVAVGELQSTHDDLITGSDAEHKFSPRIVERQFELAGFRRLSKQLIGPVEYPERQSMFVYEHGLEA